MSSYCICGGSGIERTEYSNGKLVVAKEKCLVCDRVYKTVNMARVMEDIDRRIFDAENVLSVLKMHKRDLIEVMPEENVDKILRAVYKQSCTCIGCRPDLHEVKDCACGECLNW